MKKLEGSGILFGGDYNPEQWPEETWQSDIDKLKMAKVNVATINVFSWALLEPREGDFNFEKLDKIIALLQKNDFKIILATATAALPAWLVQKYPEVSRVDVHGVRQRQGKRHNACPNSPDFRRLAQELVKRVAHRYATCPNLIYWHVSNEYEGYCYCENCASAFRRWLFQKYGTLEKLNLAWDSNVWSHTYHEWSEIEPPMMTTDLFENGKPVLGGADLDYRHFQSDSLLANFKIERDAIKNVDQLHPVTTNFTGTQKNIDYFKWAPELDVISWDSYPMPQDTASETAMEHDLMRGLKQQPFLLMEQTPNQQNWYPYNALKLPGEMRMLSYQAIAHGANTVQFFQLKQSRSGAEKFHGAVIGHSNSTDTRVFREVQQLGGELASLPRTLLRTNVKATVAMIFDWESYWASEDSIGPIANFSYLKAFQSFYQMFYSNGISVDLISKKADFREYQVVVAPILYTVDQDLVDRLTTYVVNGGLLLTTYLSGMTDSQDQVYLGGYPGPLRQLLGIHIDERDARTPQQSVRLLANNEHKIGTATGICDLVIPDTALTLAHYSDDVFYSDRAVLTNRAVGRGNAMYCGASLDDQGLDYVLQKVTELTSLIPHPTPYVEVTTRVGATQKFIFIINTSNQSQRITNPAPKAKVLLARGTVANTIYLVAYDVVILQEELTKSDMKE